MGSSSGNTSSKLPLRSHHRRKPPNSSSGPSSSSSGDRHLQQVLPKNGVARVGMGLLPGCTVLCWEVLCWQAACCRHPRCLRQAPSVSAACGLLCLLLAAFALLLYWCCVGAAHMERTQHSCLCGGSPKAVVRWSMATPGPTWPQLPPTWQAPPQEPAWMLPPPLPSQPFPPSQLSQRRVWACHACCGVWACRVLSAGVCG